MVPIKLKIIVIAVSLLFTGFLFHQVRKEVLELRYTLIWFTLAAVMIALAVFPEILVNIAGIMGIGIPVNALFFVSFFCVLVILLSMSFTISQLYSRVTRLVQEVGILKNELLKFKK